MIREVVNKGVVKKVEVLGSLNRIMKVKVIIKEGKKRKKNMKKRKRKKKKLKAVLEMMEVL